MTENLENVTENITDLAEVTTEDVVKVDDAAEVVSGALDNLPSTGESVAGIAIGAAVCIGVYEFGKHVVVPAGVSAFNWTKGKIQELKARKPKNNDETVDADYKEVDAEQDSKEKK